MQDTTLNLVKGVLRGLHYQLEPYAQGSISCVEGEVFDVAVDIRKSSPTFGQWVGVYLNAKNKRQLWIPEGYSWIYCTTGEKPFLYKATNYYTLMKVRIIWNDKSLNIQWPLMRNDYISKDQQQISLTEYLEIESSKMMSCINPNQN